MNLMDYVIVDISLYLNSTAISENTTFYVYQWRGKLIKSGRVSWSTRIFYSFIDNTLQKNILIKYESW